MSALSASGRLGFERAELCSGSVRCHGLVPCHVRVSGDDVTVLWKGMRENRCRDYGPSRSCLLRLFHRDIVHRALLESALQKPKSVKRILHPGRVLVDVGVRVANIQQRL